MKPLILITVLACLLGSTSCMMPDPETTRAKNEAILFAEGFRVPFYKTAADGTYELGEKDSPLFESGVAAPALTEILLRVARQGMEVNNNGEPVGSNLGSTNYLLYFAPSVGSPNSLQQLRKLAGWDAELQAAGIKPIAIMGDPMEQISAAKTKYSIGISLLHDPGLKVATQYGCAIEGSTFAQRTIVGVDKSGNVAFFSRGFAFTGTKQILEEFGISTK